MRIEIQQYPALPIPHPALDSFLEIPPRTPDALNRAQAQLRGRTYPRKQLVEILTQYNQSVGNDPMALDNVRELESPDKFCIVTGQQLGLCGGPAYTILKAITCLSLARETDAIPVFWLATEDHDVAEIDHTYLIDPRGNLKEYRLHLPKNGTPVEELKLSAQCFSVIEQFAHDVGMKEILEEVAEGDFYARSMTRLLCRLFEGTGLVFLEPRVLRPLAIPFFKREIANAEEIKKLLQDNLRKLETIDSHSPWVPLAATNLFFIGEDKIRRRILYKEGKYSIGEANYSAERLISLIEESPTNFSTNVLARPVLQNLLLPTLAHVVGPNELRYSHQLKEYHHFHGTVMPWIVPRLSATIVPPEAQEFLQRCHKQPWENIPQHWHELMPALDMGMADTIEEWNQIAHTYFQEELPQDILARHVKSSAMKLHKRIVSARLRKLDIPYYALHYLRNLLHPHNKLQERVLNWWGFQAQASENLIQSCVNSIDWRTEGHTYIFL